jgi:hypothetical protein
MAGLFHQAAQIRLGIAQRKHLRLQINLLFSGARMSGNFHRLNLVYIQADVEHHLKFMPAAAA